MFNRESHEVELYPTWRNIVTISYGVGLYVGLNAVVDFAVAGIEYAMERRKENKQKREETIQE